MQEIPNHDSAAHLWLSNNTSWSSIKKTPVSSVHVQNGDCMFCVLNMTVLLFVYIAYLKASQNKLHCDAAAEQHMIGSIIMIIIVGWFKTKDGSPSWTLGRIEMTEMIKHMIKLKLMKNLFRWQPLDWKVSWEIMLSLDYRIRCKKSSALP